MSGKNKKNLFHHETYNFICFKIDSLIYTATCTISKLFQKLISAHTSRILSVSISLSLNQYVQGRISKKENKPFHYYKRMVNRSLMINSTFDRCVVVSIVLRLVCINWLILVDCSMK